MVEVKTAVPKAAVGARTNNTSAELILSEIDTKEFRAHYSKKHAAKIVHQCVAINLRWFLTPHYPSLRFCVLFSLDAPTNSSWPFVAFTTIRSPQRYVGIMQNSRKSAAYRK